MEKNIDMLSRINVGDIVTADMLNAISGAINRNTRAVATPRQRDDDNLDSSDTGFTETGRTVSTVQVFDQNEENYADIERIESISFRSDQGDTLTLNFNN